MTEGYVTLDDAKLYFRIYGNHQTAHGKPRVLLLHGNGESGACYSKVIPLLEPYLELLVLDSRGHGRSGWGTKKLTIRGMAADALAVLDALRISRIHVVGFSDGGNIALAMALQNPRKVDRLVLAGANLDPSGLLPAEQARDAAAYEKLAAIPAPNLAEKQKLALLDLMVNQPDFTPEEISSIVSPTLVLAGDRDVIQESHTRLIADSIPGAELCILQDCDHFVFSTRPEAAAQRLLDFFRQS